MIQKFFIIISIIIVIMSNIDFSWAYDGSVHSLINEKAVKSYNVNGMEIWPSQLNSVLKSQLGITEGIEAEIEKDGKTKQIWQWIAFGGEDEDYGMKL